MKLPDIHFAKTPFEIGMVAKLSEEVRESFLKLSPGEPVTVRKFTAVARGFANNNTMLPGIYENFRWMEVELPNGKMETVPEHYLDDTGLPRVLRERAKIADLPTIPFCEGDTVIGPDGRYSKIVNIDYLSIWNQQGGDEVSNMDKRPYSLQTTDKLREFDAAENEMKLVTRGMVYAFYHGNAVDFDDAEEEARFYAWIGHAEGVVNQAGGTRAFSRDEAIAALQAGEADVVFSANKRFQPLVDEESYHLSKFRDEAVGARVREAYLATLDVSAPKFGG